MSHFVCVLHELRQKHQTALVITVFFTPFPSWLKTKSVSLKNSLDEAIKTILLNLNPQVHVFLIFWEVAFLLRAEARRLSPGEAVTQLS